MNSIYLSPSTQENNVGVGSYGTEEKRCNQIVDLIVPELTRHNILVYRNKPTMNLKQVVIDSNSKNVNFHFAIHTNGFNKKTRGCEVFCHKKGGNGEKFSKIIYDRISKITPTSDRGVKEGYNFYGVGKHMYEVAYTKASASLIEIIFHDEKNDVEWFLKNIELIASELVKGILDYFNVKYIPVKKVLYRVITGSYNKKENAEKQVIRLKSLGIESFIEIKK